MRILALDTASPQGSIALLEDDSVVVASALSGTTGYGSILFEAIATVLDEVGWALTSVQAVAAAAGPGSFTGVRVGLAAAKGLAEIAGVPVFAVSNLQALAACGTRPLRATVIDARRGAVYAALYDAQLQTILPEIVQPLETWIQELPGGDLEFITNDSEFLTKALPGGTYHALLAISIARIAASQSRRGIAPDAAAAVANYVRHADAQLYWKDS